MRSALLTLPLGTLALLVAPFRRIRAARRPSVAAARRVSVAGAARMDAATRAAMLAEAERIAAPYQQHIRSLRAPTQPASRCDAFADVEALLERAGLLGG